MNQHDPLTDPIDAWLDAFVAETSTSALEPAADPDLAALRATARQFHGLAQVGERYAASMSSLPSTWEEVMHTQSTGAAVSPNMDVRRAADLVSARATPFGRIPQTVIPSLRGISPSRPLRTSPLNTTINALLAAALILALATGIWRATGRIDLGFGGDGPNQPTIPFGGAVSQVATPNAVAVDTATLPKAEDCTVEPLTVDEVLWYVREPEEAVRSANMGSPVSAIPESTPSGETTPAPPRHATQPELEGIAAAHRLWMSCVMADSYFQVWALEEPDYVLTQVLPAIQSLSDAEARAVLQDLEANGPSEDGPILPFEMRGYPGSDTIHLIDATPENSAQGGPLYRTGYFSYSLDGRFLRHGMLDQDGPHTTMLDSCNSYLFTWNEARDTWLVYDAPNCELTFWDGNPT